MSSKGFNFSCVDPIYGFKSLDEYAMDYYEEQRMALENLRYVAIDFTHPSQVMRNIRWYASQRINAVVGTEGVDARETLRLVNKSGIGLIYCSNFSEMAHLNNNVSGAVNEVFLAAEFIKNHRGFYNYDEFKKFSQVIARYSVASKLNKISAIFY